MASLKNAEITDVGPNSIQRAVTEDGRLYFHTTYYDDKSLAQNRKIEGSGMLDKAKLGLHDDEDIRMVISCPSTAQWLLFKKKHPETYKLIKSTIEHERMKGARQLMLLHPAWVVQNRL